MSYGYNSATNQLSKAAQTGGSTLGYSYDAAGNLTARKLGKTTQLALAYNADGRPATAGPESYKYDGFGERSLINGTTTSHDIFGRSGELLAENTSSGAVLRRYVYLNGLPLALVDGAGNIAYILADQVGQPQRMVDGSGALVWDRVADIFGATVAQPAGMTAALPLRFPGQQYDAATGLHYNYFRDYDPALGRYVQSDPIGLAGGVNTYAYVGGNPLRATDRFGLDTYIVNRDLSPFGSSARSRWDPITHTFVVVTNPDGSVAATYSWGNYANLQGWSLDQPLDISTANQALENGQAEWVGGSDLDPYVGRAFNLLNDPRFNHTNWIVTNNCKTESHNLIGTAENLQRIDRIRSLLGGPDLLMTPW